MPAGEAGLCPPADVAARDFIGGRRFFFTVTEIIARRIIACAQQGERDPARLCDLALSSLNR